METTESCWKSARTTLQLLECSCVHHITRPPRAVPLTAPYPRYLEAGTAQQQAGALQESVLACMPVDTVRDALQALHAGGFPRVPHPTALIIQPPQSCTHGTCKPRSSSKTDAESTCWCCTHHQAAELGVLVSYSSNDDLFLQEASKRTLSFAFSERMRSLPQPADGGGARNPAEGALPAGVVKCGHTALLISEANRLALLHACISSRRHACGYGWISSSEQWPHERLPESPLTALCRHISSITASATAEKC